MSDDATSSVPMITNLTSTTVSVPFSSTNLPAPPHTTGHEGHEGEGTAPPPSTPPSAKRGRKAGSGNNSLTYNIMQWNQKDLTLLCLADKACAVLRDEALPSEERQGLRAALPINHQQSLKRAENIIRTLDNSNLAACVIEEVKTGGGGKRAVEFITDGLNRRTKTSPGSWKYELSGVVNPMSGRPEMYAIIWNYNLLGDLVNTLVDDEEGGYRLMTNGLEFEGKRIGDAKRKADGDCDFKIGAAEICLDEGRRIWAEMKRCEMGWDANAKFDRMPTLFSFQPAKLDNFQPAALDDDKLLHIIAIHGATGGHLRSPHQQIAETMFLQEICGQAAEQGEYVVLLGDFNTTERYNKTERLWDDKLALNVPEGSGEFDEATELRATRKRFLHFFYRGVEESLPTNVYPFLAGGDADPKHNDDIWLPKDKSFLYMDKPKGRLGQRGSKQPGMVHKIPDYILVQWETTTRDFFISLGAALLNTAKKNRLNDLLSKVWSDHRPISVALKPASKVRTGRPVKDAAKEETEAPNDEAKEETEAPDDEEGNATGELISKLKPLSIAK